MIRRRLCLGAAAVALSLPLAGCVTVHGERALIASARPAEAAKALADFAAANNAATRTYDPARVTATEAGPLGAIDEAGVRARHVNNPSGNPSATPLVFSGTKYLIPRQRGWPKFFVADTATNRGTARWLLVFRRSGPEQAWKADFLAVYAPGSLPAPATDKDGHAEAVPLAGSDLLVQPGQLSAAYAGYLQDGAGAQSFAPGAVTSQLRASRAKESHTPSSVTQYQDQPVQGGEFDPVALRTKNGGALVFFGTRHQSRATYRPGYRLTLDPSTRALMSGTPRTSVTLSRMAQHVAFVPGGGGTGQVVILSRLVGLVSAKGA
ncbi:hypothetical protein [Actinacidiphila acididurans]|nr:hypothetical protein [Actinacidiphila acididurans]